MAVERFSITMAAPVGAAVRQAATSAGISVSAWLAAAAEDRLLHDNLGLALDAWEAEDGEFSAGELRSAAEILTRRPPVVPAVQAIANDAG